MKKCIDAVWTFLAAVGMVAVAIAIALTNAGFFEFLMKG